MKMQGESHVKEAAKAYVDTVLAERDRLGYAAKIPKKSYGRAIDRAAGVFETLRRTNGNETSDKP